MLFCLLFTLAVAAVFHFIISLVASIAYRIKIRNLLDGISSKDDLLYMNTKDFINVIAEAFRRKGHKVEFTDRCGEEGNGIIIDDKIFAVVWKHAYKRQVEIEDAMKFARCMQNNSIYRGMLITLGDYKTNTRLFCFKNVISCINGDQLLEICKEVQMRRRPLEKPVG
ncbi:MAG TPA: restriction endonuclease [Clostridiaceae bacterium]|nr:restriction endonuclease [Clostridiaceae bacterium]